MCLYPKFIINKRYTSYITKKKTKHPSEYCDDIRKLYVPIGCGNCYECRRQKAQQWRVRLMEELKDNKHSYFVTLTFTNESIDELIKIIGEDNANKVATLGVRRFLERWRKKNKKSVRHWLITELGHENTERIHLHGILFTDNPISNDYLQSIWQYGRTDIGEYCNERTINYIVKYVTKIDIEHKGFQGQIMCSSGMGKNFLSKYSTQMTYKYRPKESAEYYTLKDGHKVALPIYYRNKLYTQEERDKMWTERLDRHKIYVNGIEVEHIDTAEGYAKYTRIIEEQQRWNEEIGYGNREWEKTEYSARVAELNGCRQA